MHRLHRECDFSILWNASASIVFQVHDEIKSRISKIDPTETWPKKFVPDKHRDPKSLGVWYCPNDGCENGIPEEKKQ